MATLAQQVLVGNIGKVYDLRTVGKNNSAVLDFSLAITPRKKEGDDWVDGETYWVNCTAWNKLAENISESFKSGDRVIVVGRTDMKEGYTNKDGDAMPARPILIVDFAGLEVSYNGAESKRKTSGEGRSSAPARPAAKKAAPPKKEEAEDDIFADDFDFDDGDAPF